ncbi:hypothetical protein [Pseudovibrio sp. Ad37]|uniref:hypothetical protein n=1 Tax=Pseudovibrio sp. Ad37 TaxID=989422 RepID=UPI0007AE9827|nr:hypothetical protein [Pseudovibrio sp. Ad37]KZL18165.1 hypothetical protein PsAD37_03920 [Pseudovibrio sp. Ad37]
MNRVNTVATVPVAGVMVTFPFYDWLNWLADWLQPVAFLLGLIFLLLRLYVFIRDELPRKKRGCE